MKSENIFYSTFIVIALLFWNPVSFYFIYSNTPFYSETIIQIFYWFIFICGILSIILILNNIVSHRIKNVIFSLSLLCITFPTFIFFDWAVGAVSKTDKPIVYKQKWQIYDPNSQARYQTVEFDYYANLNSFGFRDREVPIEKIETYRILCFGDSWTFGWGVNVEDSWPKILEQYLIDNGFHNIEVINCGYPGQYTRKYYEYIKKVVPVLKPDLVLVGVLQLDDLAQLYQNKFIQEKPIKKWARETRAIALRYLKYSFKNIFESKKSIEIKSNWIKTSKSMLEGFSHLQKIRFDALDDSVKSLFKNGDLNPGLMNYYINFPDRIIIFNNPNHPATIYATQEMNKDFQNMKDICYKYNSKLIFINLANNNFTGHKVIRNPSDILNDYFMNNNNIDIIYRSIADTNNLPYIELTNHFIRLKDKSGYFFKYDGHPNENGYNEIAQYIGNQLIEMDILSNDGQQ